jgi:hypothetical protein
MYAALINGANGSSVLVNSPSASGKTSLFTLFSTRYPELKVIHLPFTIWGSNMANFCQDIIGGFVKVNTRDSIRFEKGSFYVIVLDDAHNAYQNLLFWQGLLKDIVSSYAARKPNYSVRFVISATRPSIGGVESPAEFINIPHRLSREDFLLSAEEAMELFRLRLPSKLLEFHQLLNIMIGECGGLIGALIVAISELSVDLIQYLNPTEEQAMEVFFGLKMLLQMARCFGSGHKAVGNMHLRTIMLDAFAGAIVPIPSNVKNLDDSSKKDYENIVKGGILVPHYSGLNLVDGLKFSSPLALRYYCQYLFPNRTLSTPETLEDLIRLAISNMSAHVLHQSLEGDRSFPKEAIFQQLFMEGLCKNTSIDCSVCPELSLIFPGVRIEGEIDFFVDSKKRWGIELLVKGKNISEHMQRFGVNGKYAGFKAQNYAVVDFRSSLNGIPTNVGLHEKRITVFFPAGGDFSFCNVIFGLASGFQRLSLNE